MGARFGAPYPKELHCLSPGRTVIDEALNPVAVLAAHGARVRLVVVVGPHKTATMAYLKRYERDFEIAFTYQREVAGPELGGALLSAMAFCAGPTLLVLPDQILCGEGAERSALRAVELLEDASTAVVATAVDDPEEIKREGALRVEHLPTGARVTRAAEKPADPLGFNAAWASLAVRPDHRMNLVAAVNRNAESPLVGAPAVMVQSFTNMTEPERWRTQ
ncbi:sugar phosphate nucleotidyltransferase [Streptomyces cyaneofuscatus]|uniref:sugar phosphate nucleotidyltransferase n=1 Tax=Streptomyces cyaneofuscatus TaxID=66883 RepID=UPI0033A147F1